MIHRQAEHCEYLQFRLLAEIPGLVHAVFTRRGGFSQPPFAGLNLSAITGDDRATVARNRDVVVRALGLPLAGTRTVHGNAVATVERPAGATTSAWLEPLRATLLATAADAMLADQPGFALCWAYGDCTPVLLFDPRHRAFALIHAGWRGTAAAVVPAAVAAMAARYGTRAHELLAGVGPAVGACCYEIGPEVRDTFAAHPLAAKCVRFVERPNAAGTPALYLDVAAANVAQLRASGVRAEHIETSGYCTGCRTDLFYSHRREPKPSGRFAVAIGLRDERALDDGSRR
ncbi:MAG: peptidoglycan editing factor PgeF [Ktedonobacterales bacterium]